MEEWRFDTEAIRRAIDDYKTRPTVQHRRRVQRAFAEFDEKIRILQSWEKCLTGEEKEGLDLRIADLCHRREMHRMRCISLSPRVPVRVAERATRR